MKKINDFSEFLKQLEEAVENLQNEIDTSDRPIFIDITINLCPQMDAAPVEYYIQKEGETPIDILETDSNIYAVVGLPGMETKNIILSCTGQTLEITASNAVKTMNETIQLPARVNKKGMKSTYKNGILEVIFNKPRKRAKRE